MLKFKITNLFSSNRKGRGACLENENNELVKRIQYSFKEELPGHRFDLDAQCKLSLGDEYRPHIAPNVPFNVSCM